MKINSILFYFIFAGNALTSCSQSTPSLEFCGKHVTAPKGCEKIGNMIKCSDYVFVWMYEPIADLPRHQTELLAQLKNPEKINVSVVDHDLVGYVSNMGTSGQLLIIGNVNGQGVIVNLFLNKPINSTNDLPDFVRQLITIKQ